MASTPDTKDGPWDGELVGLDLPCPWGADAPPDHDSPDLRAAVAEVPPLAPVTPETVQRQNFSEHEWLFTGANLARDVEDHDHVDGSECNVIVYNLLHLPALVQGLLKVIPAPHFDRNLEAMMETAFFLTHPGAWNPYRGDAVLRRTLELAFTSWQRCRIRTSDGTPHFMTARSLMLCRDSIDAALWRATLSNLEKKLLVYLRHPEVRKDECINHIPVGMAAAAECASLLETPGPLLEALTEFAEWFHGNGINSAGFMREFGGPNSGWSALKSLGDLAVVHHRLPGSRSAELAEEISRRYFHWWSLNVVPAGTAHGLRSYAYNQAPSCTRTCWPERSPYPHFGTNNYWASVLPEAAALSADKPDWQIDPVSARHSAVDVAAVAARPFEVTDYNARTWGHGHWAWRFHEPEVAPIAAEANYRLPAETGKHYSLFSNDDGNPEFLFFGTHRYYAALAFGEVRHMHSFGFNELTLLWTPPGGPVLQSTHTLPGGSFLGDNIVTSEFPKHGVRIERHSDGVSVTFCCRCKDLEIAKRIELRPDSIRFDIAAPVNFTEQLPLALGCEVTGRNGNGAALSAAGGQQVRLDVEQGRLTSAAAGNAVRIDAAEGKVSVVLHVT